MSDGGLRAALTLRERDVRDAERALQESLNAREAAKKALDDALGAIRELHDTRAKDEAAWMERARRVTVAELAWQDRHAREWDARLGDLRTRVVEARRRETEARARVTEARRTLGAALDAARVVGERLAAHEAERARRREGE